MKKIDETTLAIVSPYAGFDVLVIKVNTDDNTVPVDRQEFGDTNTWGWGYGMLFRTGAGGGLNNYVNPCSGIIRVNISYTVAIRSFGEFALELKKVQ